MKKYVKPIKLGKLLLPTNVFFSPLAGCSDYPFRQMASLFKPGLMFCEMVKMDALIRHEPSTYHLLDYDPSMRPIGGQLCGSKPELAGPTARIIEELGFDVVDLNCGCPVDKVTKDGSGSGMLKNPELIGEVISNMVAAVSIPVTVKIRAGWDEESINASLITKIAEQAGAQAISIHGRTRQQKYTGRANWDHIKDAKKTATSIKVIGNGDVFDAEAGLALFKHTGCDAILVSRGTFGKPWIAEEVRRLDQGLSPFIPDVKETLLKHLAYTAAYQTDRKALLDMRRVGCWYLRSGTGTKKLRESLNRTQKLTEVETLINNYDWEQTNFNHSHC
ncbi:MAG: tRNA dihydrouridine synthase DusB [Simkaniaceae bacterium]|nr:MAG: tRNA dihydrouridine synthase DusB [Simkaniaceae bacterium]